VVFDQALVPIENDEDVCYLIGLLMNNPFVSMYVEHEDKDNCVNLLNVVSVELEVDDDVPQRGGLEELDISLSDPDFEPFTDDVQSETNDEDMIRKKI